MYYYHYVENIPFKPPTASFTLKFKILILF